MGALGVGLSATLPVGLFAEEAVLVRAFAAVFATGLATALTGALETGFNTFDVFVFDEDTVAFGGAFFCEVATGLLAALTGFLARAFTGALAMAFGATFLATALGAALGTAFGVEVFLGAAFFAGFLVDMFNP